MDEKTDSSRLGCKKCGYPGHFAYQCRNDVKALLNANRTALKIEKEKAKVQMASIESRSIPPSVALSSNAFTNPNMIPITTKWVMIDYLYIIFSVKSDHLIMNFFFP